MTTDQSQTKNKKTSRLDKAILALPDPPSFKSHNRETVVWIMLGTANGAWLIEYNILPGQTVIWGAMFIAIISQVITYD
jgi:hypothetical protein